MSSYPRWLLDLVRGKAPGERTDVSNDQDPTHGQLELARTLARDGHLHDAAREYSNLSRRHGPPEVLLEHAELLLALGDQFGAAFNATRVLEVEPKNPRALAIRNEVLRRDLQTQPR